MIPITIVEPVELEQSSREPKDQTGEDSIEDS